MKFLSRLWRKPELPRGCAVLLPILGYEGTRYAGIENEDGTVEVPGGTVEMGEKPRFAAFRETLEEIGIAPWALRPIYDREHVGKHGQRYHAFVFVGFPIERAMWSVATPEPGKRLVALSRDDLTGPKGRYRDLMVEVFMHWITP